MLRGTSHLLQMRGLKRGYKYDQNPRPFVASFTDAWIETINESVALKCYIVASFTDAWIETVDSTTIFQPQTVASFTDAWIET